MNNKGSKEQSNENSSSRLAGALAWLVSILVPVVLALTGVRLMMTPAFVRFEYSTPNFPADPYGFTKQDRLHWSQIALDYLLNDEGIEFLGDLQFEDGSPVYNERELRHMVDVKNAVRVTLVVWYLALGGLLILGVWAWRGNWMPQFKAGLRRGGWLTVALVGMIIASVLVSFGVFFVAFHNMFFEPGTWMFYFSDTLIRLFPERFWRDIFIYVGLLALAGGLTLGLGLKKDYKQVG